MRFEFDADKSASNRQKHGIDFVKGQAIWDDPNRCRGDIDFVLEQRSLVTGKIDGKTWTAVITYRFGVIRIISIRRARRNEEARYGR